MRFFAFFRGNKDRETAMMNESEHNIPSLRAFARRLYVFLPLIVILIIFLMALTPEPSQTIDITPKTDAVTIKESLTPRKVSSEKITKQKKRDEEEKIYGLRFKSAQKYIKKGEEVDYLYAKVENYDKALQELAQVPKRAKYKNKIDSYVNRLREELINSSTIKIKIGDTEKKLKQIYKEPDKVKILEKYLPKGSMKYAYYNKLGVRFGLNKGRIYSIKYESNFKGISRGIKMDDSIRKIKRIHAGRIIPFSGGIYGYQELDRKTTYLFVDNDDFADGIEQFDKAIYGEWDTIIK